MADELLNKGVIAISALVWDGSGGKEEELALLHVGFLFKNYEVYCPTPETSTRSPNSETSNPKISTPDPKP
jgi:hypothetical protein